MEYELLGGELIVKICYENLDKEFDDNICLSLKESCPDETRIFRAAETNLFITAEEARKLAEMLLTAADSSDRHSRDSV